MAIEFTGEQVRRLRKAAGISQGHLAELMREQGQETWWQTTVSRVEKGSQKVTELADIEALTKIFNDAGVLNETIASGDPTRGVIDTAVRDNLTSRLAEAEESVELAEEALKRARTSLTMARALVSPPAGQENLVSQLHAQMELKSPPGVDEPGPPKPPPPQMREVMEEFEKGNIKSKDLQDALEKAAGMHEEDHRPGSVVARVLGISQEEMDRAAQGDERQREALHEKFAELLAEQERAPRGVDH